MYDQEYYLANRASFKLAKKKYYQKKKEKQIEEKPVTEEDLDKIIEWYDKVRYGLEDMSTGGPQRY